jgi:glycerol-3-phosphate acyltransferase PlsX
LTSGICDVVVTDGFTGNVALKVVEGAGSMIKKHLKGMFGNPIGMFSALLVKGAIDKIKKSMDYTEQGGAPLLGLQKTVIKAHGSSNAKAIKNAVRQAKFCVQSDINGKLAAIFTENE